jgi:hypothetical protein
MKTSKLFLASMVLVALACLSTVQGQYEMTNIYSSSISTTGSNSSATYQYGQYYTMPAGQTASAYQVPTASPVPGSLAGTFLTIRDENSMYVNFTKSNIPGMQGTTLILLPRPVSMRILLYFQGKELSFSLLGHDILGRPICDVYFNGLPIEDYTSEYGYYSHPYGYYSPQYGYYSPMNGYYSPQDGYYSPPYRNYSFWHEYYSPGSITLNF